APGMVPFSADMSLKTHGENVNGKYYVGDHKIRTDMSMHGQDISQITDASTQTSYMLMHKQHMYMEIHAGQSPMMNRGPKVPDLKSYDPNNPCANDPNTTCKNEGTETVNGRSANKWVFTNKSDGNTMTAWLDKKLHFPIRTITSNGTEMDLTNIQEGAPSASLFEVPAGYQKFDMGAMMGGRMPQQ
ncbi:MAG TPA: DUF4412 domain-containing protein, partial [Terriglobales bacterium]|nr:DUF4412 domain-containing protein [Terriglobales bacterium]